MRTVTPLILVFTLGFGPLATAQPAPIGRLIVTEQALHQGASTHETARAPQATSAQAAGASSSSAQSRAAAAVGAGFAGFLLGSWLGQAAGGGGEQGLPAAYIGASVGALVGVLLVLR